MLDGDCAQNPRIFLNGSALMKLVTCASVCFQLATCNEIADGICTALGITAAASSIIVPAGPPAPPAHASAVAVARAAGAPEESDKDARIAALEAANKSLRRRLDVSQKGKRRLRAANAFWRRSNKAALKQLEAMKMGIKKGKTRRYCSVRGGYGMAIKRVLSNVNTHSLGLMLETDISGTAVRQWELKLRASQLLSLRAWMQ